MSLYMLVLSDITSVYPREIQFGKAVCSNMTIWMLELLGLDESVYLMHCPSLSGNENVITVRKRKCRIRIPLPNQWEYGLSNALLNNFQIRGAEHQHPSLSCSSCSFCCSFSSSGWTHVCQFDAIHWKNERIQPVK